MEIRNISTTLAMGWLVFLTSFLPTGRGWFLGLPYGFSSTTCCGTNFVRSKVMVKPPSVIDSSSRMTVVQAQGLGCSTRLCGNSEARYWDRDTFEELESFPHDTLENYEKESNREKRKDGTNENNDNSEETFDPFDDSVWIDADTGKLVVLENWENSSLWDENLLSDGPSDEETDADAEDPKIAYFYLRNVLGLDEVGMWRVVRYASSVLSLKADTVRRKVEYMIETFGLSQEEMRTVVTNMPAILHLNSTRNVQVKAEYLQLQLALNSTKDLKDLVLSCPSALCYSIDNLRAKFDFFQTNFNITPREMHSIVLKEPKLLTCSVQNGLVKHLDYFQSKVQMPMPDFRHLVLQYPSIFRLGIQDNIHAKVECWMKESLQWDAKDISDCLRRYPRILEYSLENLLDTTQFWKDTFPISNKDLSVVFRRAPRLLTCSPSKIIASVLWFQEQLGLSIEEVTRFILRVSPGTFGLAENALQARLDFLKQLFFPERKGKSLGLDEMAVIRRILLRCPTMLHLKIESNLSPKVDYLIQEMGSSQALSRAIQSQPTLLAFSLAKRISPRLERMKKIGVDLGLIGTAANKSPHQFDEWLERKQELQKESTKKQAYARVPRPYKRNAKRKAADEREGWREPVGLSVDEGISESGAIDSEWDEERIRTEWREASKDSDLDDIPFNQSNSNAKDIEWRDTANQMVDEELLSDTGLICDDDDQGEETLSQTGSSPKRVTHWVRNMEGPHSFRLKQAGYNNPSDLKSP
eukprot:Nitzschia sp. Nitz4//scaffold11_size288233//10824//13085//NITZ4_000725-RA/size288233-processed-gene-0.151-mRNA-1//1//CDS//3329533927//4230//frame0